MRCTMVKATAQLSTMCSCYVMCTGGGPRFDSRASSIHAALRLPTPLGTDGTTHQRQLVPALLRYSSRIHTHTPRPLCTPHRPCAGTSALESGSPMFSYELFRPLLWCNHSRPQHWRHWPCAPAPTNPPSLAPAHAMHVAPNARANTSTGFTEAARLPPHRLRNCPHTA